jgi:Protein of unknown function (DUF3037)
MRIRYSFSVLRYIHDPATQEFVNIGVALFSSDVKYLKAICTQNYGRISQLFQKQLDGQKFRQLSRFIQDRIWAIGREYSESLPFESLTGIDQILPMILPRDDSAIQFSRAGVGITEDLDATLQELYERFVNRYAAQNIARRSDDDVWKVFKEQLDRAQVTDRLRPKRIVAPNYEYDFQRSWKNESWHVFEPVSFDMVEGSSMLEKANRWVGRATGLMDSPEPFEMHILLGQPQDQRLRETYIKAQNLMNKMPCRKEFVQESDAADFAQNVAADVKRHEAEEQEA